ncbi:hypothetical protein [Goodfellowiella coeruleoviolacea]|uniref:Uncharacterized protein n=1 Tax=Goodfellowiella coeruleoviolacea TaxID=334858 RepID=A0AAE3GDB5_9PSEU|nr:hypothetical protein [Goodfellowiella coeruleoviolacea]MCP2165279.1 hypothetical protein [Goodfellowiella coeruleoviolacea]
MHYRWRYQDEQAGDVPGPEEIFDAQAEAEDWLSAVWAQLYESGVHQVTLLHGESEVYGPMSLAPADS